MNRKFELLNGKEEMVDKVDTCCLVTVHQRPRPTSYMYYEKKKLLTIMILVMSCFS